jgi:hypothetical protein
VIAHYKPFRASEPRSHLKNPDPLFSLGPDDVQKILQHRPYSSEPGQQMADTDPAPAPAPKGVLLKAETIAEPFLAEVKASLADVSQSRARAPKLVGILATANAPSRSYAEFTRRQCVALGIEFELREVGAALPDGLGGGADGDGVEEAIIDANADDAVDGIMASSVDALWFSNMLIRFG